MQHHVIVLNKTFDAMFQSQNSSSLQIAPLPDVKMKQNDLQCQLAIKANREDFHVV